jgi:hypothetical protein
MKSTRREKTAVTKPLLKKLTTEHKASLNNAKQNPTIGADPLQSAELDQDPGAGYNPDHTVPQS